jgi:crotonobetainyl-CoA:carnitine CoA-transferase CaiB-like acyl-CoA transferase
VDPLSGVRVVELARLIPGDVAGQALADLGADVIKVEGPPLGDYLRHIPPILGEMSALHAASNRNKRSIAIDHRSEAGRDLIYRLIRTADVVLEVSDPGSMAKYKLDYESIRLVNPKVVYCSVTGFGQTGPYAHLPSHGANMECLAGTMTLEDTPEGPRLGPLAFIATQAGAYQAALGICAALFAATRTGEGCYIDASCWDAGVTFDGLVATLALNGMKQVDGLLTPRTPKYAPYYCQDGRAVVVCTIERQFWERFCGLIGRPDLIDRHSSEFPTDYGEHDSGLYPEIAEVMRTRTADEWGHVFAESDVPCCPVLSPDEAAASGHGATRGITRSATEQGGLKYRTVNRALVMNGSRGKDRYAPPRYGQHTDVILSEIGCRGDEISRLREQKIIP